jgi:hypothetical protein
LADGFGLRQQLDGRISAARRALFLPAVLKAWGAPMLWLAAFATLWLTGLTARFAPEARAVLGLVFYAGLIWLAWRATRRWRAPSDMDGRTLIDDAVEGRPMSVWADRPARADKDGWELWEAHRERMAALAMGVRRFDLRGLWQSTDPFYTRLIAPLVVLAAALLAGTAGPDRLARGLAPDIGALFGAHRLTVEAWITPPPYTGAAPFVLTSGQGAKAPEGSEVTLRVISPGQPTVRVVPTGGESETLRPDAGADGAYEAKVIVQTPSRISVRFWGERAAFNFTVADDLAPKAEFITPPKMGEGDRTEFEYKVSDDYGVTKLELVARLAKPPAGAEAVEEAVVVEMTNYEPREEQAKFSQDLVRHRWAGLDVMVRLRATDAAGAAGESAEVAYKFPDKIFLQPIARSAQEARATLLREWRPYAEPREDDRFTLVPESEDGTVFAEAAASRLSQAPDGVKRAAAMLEAMTFGAEDYVLDPVVFMGLALARSMIESAQDKDSAELSEQVLWDVALRAEYGSVADAKAALEAARRALEQALRSGASKEDIQRLMDMYQAAVENYLAAQMAEALRDGRVDTSPGQPQAGDSGGAIGDDEMQRMLDMLRELSEKGDTEAARELLAEMDKMLERMQNMQIQMGQGGGQGQQQEGPMSRALNRALQDTNRALNEQRDLNDMTEDALREGDAQAGQELADRQRQLRERLEQQMRSGGGQPGQEQQGQQGQGGPQGEGQQPGQQGQQGQGQGQQGQEGQGQQGQGQQGQGQQGDRRGPGQGQGQLGQNGPLRDGPGGGREGVEGGARPGQENDRSRRMLGQALDAQRRAEDALRRGDFAGAREAQREAMQALQSRSNELARLADEQDPDAQADRDERDPLGRRLQNGDSGYGDQVEVPEELDRQRARDILDEIRRRAGDRTLREEELEYLRRLLDRF